VLLCIIDLICIVCVYDLVIKALATRIGFFNSE
jgi:hypothetical protein